MCKWVCIVLALVLVIAGIAMADFPDYKSTPKASVSGSYLEAWSVCWQDFLKHKGIDALVIAIAPIQPDEGIIFGGGAIYWIDKKSLKITSKDFYK
jgi:hypothetical protein